MTRRADWYEEDDSEEAEDEWSDWYEDEEGEEEEDYDEDTGWYQDENGRWHYQSRGKDYKNGSVEIDGKYYYFDEDGLMLSNTITTENGNKVCYGADGAMVKKGWIQYSDGSWGFVSYPYSHVMYRGIVCDNNMYYVIDDYRMKTGTYYMDWAVSEYCDVANNYDKKYFPQRIGRGTVELGESGAVTSDKLPISQGTQTEYQDLISALFGSSASTTALTDAEKFAYADMYVATAMAEHGIYYYQLSSREYITGAMYGGFTAVYKVYIPGLNSTKYLRITCAVDWVSGKPMYSGSSL